LVDKRNLIDTNVIIHFPSVFQNLKNIHVHLKTVEELDRLKESENAELSYRARKGAKLIAANLNNIIIERGDFRQKTVDDILLKCAQKNDFTLITNDLTLQLKCKFNKVESIAYTNGDKTQYTGIEIVEVNNADEVLCYSTMKHLITDVCENQYVVFKNVNKPIVHPDETIDYESVGQFIKKGEKLNPIKDYYITNAFNKKITSRNVEQRCLINSLFDKEISILCVTGGYGTGKL